MNCGMAIKLVSYKKIRYFFLYCGDNNRISRREVLLCTSILNTITLEGQ